MLTLIRCPFHPRVTAVARESPRSFCQRCRWQVTRKHAYTLDPTKSEWADFAAVEHNVRAYQKTSSHATRQGTLSHSRLSSLSHCGLILAYRVELVCTSLSPLKQKKKEAQARNEWSNILPKSSQARKKPPSSIFDARRY